MTYRRFVLLVMVGIVGPMSLAAPGCGMLISRDQEIAMGIEAAPEFEKEFDGPVNNATLQAYIREVGAKVAAVSDRDMPYEYTVLKSDVPNAFALPGGKIYVTAGLMRRMANEQQLAAVLGHETGHVAEKHNVKGMERQMGVIIFAEVLGSVGGSTGAAAEAGAKIAGSMVTMKYGRGDEHEADHVGLYYMEKAGYNPWGMVELLTILLNLSEKEPGALPPMFSTHPLSSERIAETKKAIESDDKLKTYSPDTLDPRAGRFLQMRALLPAPAPVKK